MLTEPTSPKLRRHVPLKGQSGIYWSERADKKRVYEVRFYDSDGKRRYQAVGPRLDTAKARLAEITGSKTRGERVAPVGMTLAEAVERWRCVRVIRPRTADSYESNLRLYVLPRFGRSKVRDISKTDIAEWLANLQRKDGRPGPLADGTRRLILAALDAVLEHALDLGAINANPCRQLNRRTRPRQAKLGARIAEPGELNRLLAACNPFVWLRPILLTAVYAALRLGELAGLTWGDVDFEANELHIRRQYTNSRKLGPTKGAAATIPLLPELRKVLIEQRLACENTNPDAPVFPNSRGGHRLPWDIERAFYRARERAGISAEPRQLRFHDLRHTSISLLANAPGAVLPQVQAFARHATLATTLSYVHKIESEAWAASASAALGGVLAQA